MRTLKIVLVLLLVVLSLALGFTTVQTRLTGKNQGPVISCDWEVKDISVSAPEEALLEGVTAKDAQDGDLTDRIIVGGVSKLITENTARVTYLVFDSDDNMGTMTRYVRYTDYRRPVFEITSPLIYDIAEQIQPLNRLKATDLIDGDISDSVRISTLKGTDNKNIYSATAQVTNSLGDMARVELPVIVLESSADIPQIELNEQLIYLSSTDSFDPADYIRSVETETGAGDLSEVQIDNPVDLSEPDTYWVRYTYTEENRTGTAILVVVVV